LKVYAGAYAADAKFEAFLSDGSVPVYTESRSNRSNGPSWIFTITYSGDPSAQLVLRWTVALTYRIDGNVTMQSAALTGSGENNPPAVSITSPAEDATFASPANITITANASDLDGEITKVEFYDGDSRLGQALSSPYTFTWMNAPPGYHVLTAVATDTNADFSTSTPVEIFVNTTGGALSGSIAIPTNHLDLTLEGTSDWAHWGLSTNSNFDHKSGVTQKIPDLAVFGDNPVERYEDNHTAFSWSDGTPTPTATNSTTGVFITGVTNGFRIEVPADTTHRRLKVYVGLYGARGNFQAWLSDFSAPAYTDTSISNLYQSSYAVVTLDYSAASAGQSLIVQFKSLVLYDLDFGNVTWQAATLVEDVQTSSMAPSITQQPVSQVVTQGANVLFSVAASGTAPLAYQWRFGVPGVGGGDIPGATNATLTITNAQPTNAGNYRVVITNSAGSTNSVVATLTVLSPLQLEYELVLSSGVQELRIYPTVAQPYALDSSSNLTSWTSIFTNQTGAGSNYYQGTINRNYRFFRGRHWP